MLDDAIKTGTALDCTVNAELLKNIFWNKARSYKTPYAEI